MSVNNAAPTVNSINPTFGPGGTVVTVSGKDFGDTQMNSFLEFNGQRVNVASWSDTVITVQIPLRSDNHGGDIFIHTTCGSQPGFRFSVTG